MRGEQNGSKLLIVIVCKRSKSKVGVCSGAEPLYLKGLFGGRKEILAGCFEAGWTMKVILGVDCCFRWAGLKLELRCITSHRKYSIVAASVALAALKSSKIIQ